MWLNAIVFPFLTLKNTYLLLFCYDSRCEITYSVPVASSSSSATLSSRHTCLALLYLCAIHCALLIHSSFSMLRFFVRASIAWLCGVNIYVSLFLFVFAWSLKKAFLPKCVGPNNAFCCSLALCFFATLRGVALLIACQWHSHLHQ